MLAPRALARALGMEGQEGLIAGYGVREIATGIGILGCAGSDALDLGPRRRRRRSISRRWRRRSKADNPKKGNVGIAMAAVAGVTALDVYCAQTLSRESPHPLPPLQDYSDRSGFPRGIKQSHGAASDFEVPRDFRTPEALRPYTQPETPRHPQPSM